MEKQSSKMNKKSMWALGLSIAAIVLSLLVFALWAFEVIPHCVITAESFIGACVALLAIIVAFVLGWQIYNAIEIKEKVNEIVGLQKEQEKLKSYIEQTKKDIQEANITNAVYHCTMLGLGASNTRDYVSACRFLINALKYTLQLQHPIDPQATLLNLSRCSNAIKNKEISQQHYNEILNADKAIRASAQYELFGDVYESCYNILLSKIHVRDTRQ